jgi:hypothetical protein
MQQGEHERTHREIDKARTLRTTNRPKLTAGVRLLIDDLPSGRQIDWGSTYRTQAIAT